VEVGVYRYDCGCGLCQGMVASFSRSSSPVVSSCIKGVLDHGTLVVGEEGGVFALAVCCSFLCSWDGGEALSQ